VVVADTEMIVDHRGDTGAGIEVDDRDERMQVCQATYLPRSASPRPLTRF